MDWYYPILCGVITGDGAQKRLDKYWKKFVVEDRGVRCVSDKPWVTIAETSELTLALAGIGNHVCLIGSVIDGMKTDPTGADLPARIWSSGRKIKLPGPMRLL
jgi:hypothetical protein